MCDVATHDTRSDAISVLEDAMGRAPKQARQGAPHVGFRHAGPRPRLLRGGNRLHLVASNSMILHEIYFDGLGGGSKPSGALQDAIARDFGSMERWRSEFV